MTMMMMIMVQREKLKKTYSGGIGQTYAKH